jgi:PAS domain S-box-containing protein
MDKGSTWFLAGSIPDNAILTHYDWILFSLSYVVAVFASYVALGLVSRMREEENPRIRRYWLAGGAFTLGAGIWAMHFIGLLAFIMPVLTEYDVIWTFASLITAILVSGLALFILQKNYTRVRLAMGGVLIGLGVATMHYMGMEAMKIHLTIQYIPWLFVLSFLVAIVVVEVSLWLALHHDRRRGQNQFGIQLVSSLLMGIAMCGMHYTGMAAAVFTPPSTYLEQVSNQGLSPNHLAFFVATVTLLLISLALAVSAYYKKMVVAVENEKEFLNAMLDNIEDGIIACNASGQITVLNGALQKHINSNKANKSIHDLQDLFQLYTPDNTPVEIENYPLRRALKGEHVHGMEFLIRFRNKVTREVVIDGQSIINSVGAKLGAVIVIHDVTELKQTEKLKDEFVSTVSHELRTPLTSIRGSLGLLISGIMGEFSDKARKLLEIANSNCERLLFLISDILDMEKIEAGKMNYDMKPVDLNELIRRCLDDNKMYAEKFCVNMTFIPSSSHVHVIADSERLAQVLTNLISNACKFSPIYETVTITLTQREGKVRVAVADKGVGISNEFQARLFQKFSQADSSDTRTKGGTGLGLHISKSIIEKFGGTLNCLSKPGEGAIFYFELNVTQASDSVQTESMSTNAPTQQRILICEDDEDQSNYLKILLESSGYWVDVAHTVAQAKGLLSDYDYHILLLDLILPDQDGIAFLRELRSHEETKTLPVIVLSAIAQTGRSLVIDEDLQVLDWLEKPTDFKLLLASINKVKKAQMEPLEDMLW